MIYLLTTILLILNTVIATKIADKFQRKEYLLLPLIFMIMLDGLTIYSLIDFMTVKKNLSICILVSTISRVLLLLNRTEKSQKLKPRL
jgi:hypothetical protein